MSLKYPDLSIVKIISLSMNNYFENFSITDKNEAKNKAV